MNFSIFIFKFLSLLLTTNPKKFLHEYDFDQVVEERKIDTTASISMSTLEVEILLSLIFIT